MAPVLNFQILDELGDDLGDADFLRDTIAGYLTELPRRQADMRAAFDENDRPELRGQAHSLGSASLMLGAVELAGACASIERSALTADPSELMGLFEVWVDASERTAVAMGDWLAVQGSNR